MPSKICHLFRILSSPTEWNQGLILYAYPSPSVRPLFNANPPCPPDADPRILRRQNPMLRRKPYTTSHLLLWSIFTIPASVGRPPDSRPRLPSPDSPFPGSRYHKILTAPAPASIRH